ncbi:MAG: GAF domain-containing protein [Candidatus Solibacter sp.]|nr:GAF domain-containing protein [Candidatus Solibacter sp.]
MLISAKYRGSFSAATKVPHHSADQMDVERLWELYRQLGTSLDLDETLSSLDRELGRVVEYHAISVHLEEDSRLTCAYAAGFAFQKLAALEYTLGQGLPGRVAAARCPAFNQEPDAVAGLAVAMAVPLEWKERLVGVLSLYRVESREFAEDEFAALRALAPKLAACIENARAFRRAAAANTRALFERLDAEVARVRRSHGRLAVLECAVEGLDAGGPPAERIAGALRRACREYDFITPSGDSLIVVLADFAPSAPGETKSRIERVFQEAGLQVKIGAALFPIDGYDAEDLLAAAHGAAHA